MKPLFPFCGFAHDPQSILAAVQRLAIVGIELPLNGRLRVAHVRVARELGVAAFADPEHRKVSNLFYDSQLTLRHENSLPPNVCANEMAPVPAGSTVERYLIRAGGSRGGTLRSMELTRQSTGSPHRHIPEITLRIPSALTG